MTNSKLSYRDLNSSSTKQLGDELGVVVLVDDDIIFVAIVEEFIGQESSS